MMKRRWVVMCTVMVLNSLSYAAYTFEDVVVEYWAGDGDNQAMIVLDFDDNSSFAFGYQWDGISTSYDALVAIDAASDDFIMTSHWDNGQAGYFVDDLDYLNVQKRGGSWSFFNGTDGTDWASSWDGASDHNLADGDWDGWASGDWFWVGPGDWDYDFSGSVTTPVPASDWVNASRSSASRSRI